MNVTKTALASVLIIDPKVFGDERGFFLETFHESRYAEHGVPAHEHFVQDNHSRSTKGVLRGLHYQINKPQGKLVRVATGRVFDVAADVNPDSATFGQWVGVELSEDNHRQLWIPPGYAHGFCVLSEIADFEYKCTGLYDSNDEGGIVWNDAGLAVEWPIRQPLVSEKDAALPALKEADRAWLPK